MILVNREVKNATNLLSQRNFDPETRTIRKTGASANNDTVEKDVDGLVEQILDADKQRQNAELVRESPTDRPVIADAFVIGPYQYRSKKGKLGLEA